MIAALFVGLSTAGGLMSMLPIIRVLINGDTVQDWFYRQTVEQRLGVKLSQESAAVQILQMDAKGAAARAGLHSGDTIDAVPEPAAHGESVFGS